MADEPRGKRPPRIPTAVVAMLVLLAMAAGIILAFPAPPTRAFPERAQVRFWHMWTAEWKDVVDDIVERFNESQDQYEVVALSVPMSAGDSKFLLAVAGGDPPDVMAQWNPVIPKWAESNLLVPLNTLMAPAEWREFQETAYPAVKKIGMYEGQLYGVTTGLNIFACYIRLDHLEEAGLDIADFPDTMEGLAEWNRVLQRVDSAGELSRVGFLPEGIYHYAPVFGGGFYDWDAGRVSINTPQNLHAFAYLIDQHRAIGFNRVLRFKSGLAVGLGNIEWPFISGSYSIFLDGQWRVEQLAKFAPELRYATRPVPPPAGGKEHAGYVNGNFMVVPVGAKEVNGAWEFIKFWSGLEEPERAAEFYTWGGWMPLNDAIAGAPIYRDYVKAHPQFQTFLDILPSENVQALPPVPYQVFFWDRILQVNDAAARGTVTAEAAIARLEQDIAREVAARREFGYGD